MLRLQHLGALAAQAKTLQNTPKHEICVADCVAGIVRLPLPRDAAYCARPLWSLLCLTAGQGVSGWVRWPPDSPGTPHNTAEGDDLR